MPILQAGMTTYTTPELVAAVSNAGGLGIIGGLGRSPDELRSEIRQVRELTSRPFGVNHVVSASSNPAAIEVTLAQRVPVLSLSWGRSADLTYQAHEAGMKVVHQVNTPEEAGLVASDGADVIVAQGTEGGGHVGTMSTLPLVPQVVDVVDGVPVLAAGGIADGRGLAAVLMLGAQGALIGTRFLATPEARGRGHSKDVILNALGSQTVARASSSTTSWVRSGRGPGADHHPSDARPVGATASRTGPLAAEQSCDPRSRPRWPPETSSSRASPPVWSTTSSPPASW